MTTPNPPPDDQPSPEAAAPSTESDKQSTESPAAKDDTAAKDSGSSKDNGTPKTPKHRRGVSSGGTPQTAPPIIVTTTHGGGNRQRSATLKPQPTLLTDFLLGRQSPARVAAMRQQRLDSMAVRAEIKKEMREAAVNRLAQPGGVRDRVQKWQKNNAAAMLAGDPEDAASEPTDVAFNVDEDSVTEEDRQRIKFRQQHKHRRKSSAKPVKVEPTSKGEGDEEAVDDTEPAAEPASPPKKRIVSDEHWMKRRRRSPPGSRAIRMKAGGGPTPIPKNFLQRSAPNPPVNNKIAAWAAKVEPMEIPTKTKKYYSKSGDAIEVEEDDLSSAVSSSRFTEEEGSRVRSAVSRRSEGSSARTTGRSSARTHDYEGSSARTTGRSSARTLDDDGIRVRPIRSQSRKPKDSDDRIRATSSSTLPDDGIRVRPLRTKESREDRTRSRSRKPSGERPRRVASARRDPSPSTILPSEVDTLSIPDTPTRKSTRKSPPRTKKSKPPPTEITELTQTTQTTDATEATGVTEATGTSYLTGTTGTTDMTGTTHTEDLSDDRSSSDFDNSDLPSTAPAKSLADIPFGYSAFSELDLPIRGDGGKMQRPKAQRSPSFNATAVFKKVYTEGRKIITHTVAPPEPPKPAMNQPPNIENWLSSTVDPFVASPEVEKEDVEHEWKTAAKRRSDAGRRRPKAPERSDISSETTSSVQEENQENKDPKPAITEEGTPQRETSQTPPSTGLKRSGATRGMSSPLKTVPKPAPKKPFREALKEAFRGESAGHKIATKRYASFEKEKLPEPEPEHYDEDSERGYHGTRESRDHRRRSSGSRRSQSPSSSLTYDSQSSVPPAPPAAGLPRRLKPPTNGLHELSTIVSMEDSRGGQSEVDSVVSETTVTQASDFTKFTGASSATRRKSTLKRRLTKHSDLVSVLSLPEAAGVPTRAPSIRVARSLRRKTSKLENATLDDLLHEFIEDENFYQRELRTIIDGVIPVLLKEVVCRDTRIIQDLFGSAFGNEGHGRAAPDAAEKAVVSMGVALERINNHHKAIPYTDPNLVAVWLERIVPIYSAYYDVWRLGFQDLIVNLAPAAGKSDEEDSLVNALPRNAEGDVVNDNGDRVDVAHLLKRPLIRAKWLLKLSKGLRHVLGNDVVPDQLVDKFADLQAKAQRRHREEQARKTNDDASNTDTSRARDLRTLRPLDGVFIDQTREVNSKDVFSLDLAHSNGQRLECQVELIYRDKLTDAHDRGDLLIRESGPTGVQYLLFAPIFWENVSARRGDGQGKLVLMVRGTHGHDEWYELLNLETEYDDAIPEWLELLGTVPRPPAPPAVSSTDLLHVQDIRPPRSGEVDVPVGAQKFSRTLPSVPREGSPQTPSRYHHVRNRSVPTTPTLAGDATPKTRSPSASYSPDSDRTPTQSTYAPSPESDRESRRKSANSTPVRDDGAPPPPVHRTFTSKKPAAVELPPPARVKRHGSSPLKHEYRPSDVSSESSEEEDDSDSDDSYSDSLSSGDELEDEEVPETEPGISIRKPEFSFNPNASVLSDDSITPSASASQVDLRGPDIIDESVKAVATISYWSNKRGRWKEVRSDACNVSITPGLLEVHPMTVDRPVGSEMMGRMDAGADVPLIALDLTPLVMIRKSTAIDLEIRSPVRSYSKLSGIDGIIFRFRALSPMHLEHFYAAVHHSRMNNAKFRALEEEARFRSFGQGQNHGQQATSASGSGKKSWFGRKNSYRASTRAPSQSQQSGSGSSGISISASSFLKRLTGGSGLAFNIDKSSLQQHQRDSRPGSAAGPASMYTSSSSGRDGNTPPRSPSVSMASSPNRGILACGGTTDLRIRCHLLVSANKWEDNGNCLLSISRPPPGVRQELRVYHGMEKRILVTQIPKKSILLPKSDEASAPPKVVLDVVLGSRCFSMLGTRGIILNVWEDLRDDQNRVGSAPAEGALSGRVKKWCFQCASAVEANWIFGLVAREVEIP
ncbi:hypothetical protein MGG_11758 [Pyricularia oryzae 70-15]|uniref:Uncharacterized protein n=2 Tax=Pyricularia oryzae TaxID=318829 RepID=G4MPU5_PYRO7|nr:uncharacterized protein MGG_11758 [Pyricularia oryzae 70-15]EHA57242.1 hypothetical protein MGG_11758 [Pyricularia oryzae 70-15]ELQ41356.1 hypothetical protein OOU_Y34scaffold00283g50 [Pyricularia oryzae Y34]KAI7923080.1 hypothetical protein M0657_005258 [Pyricularia oryzae]KAI7926042.1 hypothetical protein M9X92_002998 [Pyricularia oryzae]